MPEVEASLPQDWFQLGAQDIQAAAILLDQEGPLPVVAFLLQQAAEKHLKGYLLSTGWTLRRIHDLEVLINEAIQKDEDFQAFLAPCQRITEYYIETRYPTGLFSPLDASALAVDLAIVRDLARLIQAKTGNAS